MWKAGHWTLSSFLILAGGEERRGDCETCNKIVYNVLKQLWNRGGYQMISRAATALRKELEEISISTLLTLELLRFVADLAAGSTGFKEGEVWEERRGDSRCNCEA